MFESVDVQVMDNGNLKLIANDTAIEEINDMWEDDRGEALILSDILEEYSTNGSYTPFYSDAISGPFVGLTDAPCIAEEMDIHDNGEAEIVGRFWAFLDYMLECPVETLANEGSVVFTLIDSTGEE